jgi:hypothetical protein
MADYLVSENGTSEVYEDMLSLKAAVTTHMTGRQDTADLTVWRVTEGREVRVGPKTVVDIEYLTPETVPAA